MRDILLQTQIGDRVQSYNLRKLTVQLTSLGPQPPWGRKLYDGSSSRVTFWNFGVLTLVIIINRCLWPHFVFILAHMSIAATSLLRDSYHHSSRVFIVCSISAI